MADVFAVTSGKGGVGKTTTAINLAVALEEAGHSTAVLDADLGMANVGEFLGIDSSATLHDVLSGSASVEEALVELDSGLSVLPGDPDLGSFAAADPDGLGTVVDSLAERHQYVIVDTGGGLSYEGIYPIELADEVILVTSPLPAAVSDTKKSKQLSDRLGVAVRGVVVTHAVDGTDADSIAADLGVELLCSVPADPTFTESAIQRQSVFEHAPDAPSTAAYRRLASAIAGREGVETAEPGDDGENESGDTDAEAETEPESKGEAEAGTETGIEEPIDEEPEPVSKPGSPEASEGVDSIDDEETEPVDDEETEPIDDEETDAAGDVEVEGMGATDDEKIGDDAGSPTGDEAEEVGGEESEEADEIGDETESESETDAAETDDSEAGTGEADEAEDGASEAGTNGGDEPEKKSGFFSRLLPFR